MHELEPIRVKHLFFFIKESIPNFCTLLLFVGYFYYMFWPDLIGHHQGDFYNTCSVYFNLSTKSGRNVSGNYSPSPKTTVQEVGIDFVVSVIHLYGLGTC
jgi:hypothetical protein